MIFLFSNYHNHFVVCITLCVTFDSDSCLIVLFSLFSLLGLLPLFILFLISSLFSLVLLNHMILIHLLIAFFCYFHSFCNFLVVFDLNKTIRCLAIDFNIIETIVFYHISEPFPTKCNQMRTCQLYFLNNIIQNVKPK